MTPAVRDFAIRELGCLCCLVDGRGYVPCEKHHLLTTGRHGNGKRLGERYTIGLCPYHHRGIGNPAVFGSPSLAREPRRFRELYDEDGPLLALQNRLIEEWRAGTMGIPA